MAASINDNFLKVGVAGTLTSLSAPGHSIAGTTITVGSTTNWPTDTAVIFGIRQVDSGGELVPGTYTEWRGVVSGSTLTSMVLMYGSDQIYPAGSTTQVFIPLSAARENRMIDALLVSHDQDGTMIDSLPLVTPKITTSINDANGNEVIKTPATGSAVNEVTVTNSATGTDPVISATGGDTNVGLRLRSKGTGDVGFSGNHSGWIDSLHNWVYASATTFTIAGVDVTAQFPVGTKIKLTQTTAKYFYVTAAAFSTNTTITVNGGSDYTLANAAITLPYYSYEATPQRFPQRFNFTPSWTNLTPGSGTNVGYFWMDGSTVHFHTRFVYGSGSSVAAGIDITPPVPVSSDYSISGTFTSLGHVLLLDSGTANYGGVIRFTNRSGNLEPDIYNASGTYAVINQISNTAPITWTTSDELRISGAYKAA